MCALRVLCALIVTVDSTPQDSLDGFACTNGQLPPGGPFGLTDDPSSNPSDAEPSDPSHNRPSDETPSDPSRNRPVQPLRGATVSHHTIGSGPPSGGKQQPCAVGGGRLSSFDSSVMLVYGIVWVSRGMRVHAGMRCAARLLRIRRSASGCSSCRWPRGCCISLRSAALACVVLH